jgi:hypothetical protein
VQSHRRTARVLHLVRRRDDVGGILRRRQHLAVAVEHAAALTRDGHGRDLLASSLGAERAALHALQPERADEHQGEQQEEAAEEEPEPAIDHSHRRLPLEANASGRGPGGAG